MPFFFQSSTWGPLPITLYAKLHNAASHFYRRATKNIFNPTIVQQLSSHSDLIVEYELVSPLVYIRVARLSLFARLAKKAPRVVLDVLRIAWGFDFGWVSALCSDLAWFACSGRLLVNSDDIPAAFDYLTVSRKSFLSSLKSYACSSFANFEVPSVHPLALPTFVPQACPKSLKQFYSYQQIALHRRLNAVTLTLFTLLVTLYIALRVCYTFITVCVSLII